MKTDKAWGKDGDAKDRELKVYNKRQRMGSGSSSGASNQDGLDLVQKVHSRKQAKCIFDDEATADVVLNLTWNCKTHDSAASTSDGMAAEDGQETALQVHLHAQVLRQCRYFEALLSNRWQERRLITGERGNAENENLDEPILIKMTVPPSRDLGSYITTLGLLYSADFAGILLDIQTSLTILPVAAELLFDECISACVSFLEAVPWNLDEEKQILQVVSDLQLEETANLLARLGPGKENAVEEMLSGLVHAATHSNQKVPSVGPAVGASVKTFVARMLNDHASRDTVRLVLEKAFASSLKAVKDSVEEYSNPNVRGLNDEIEAMQRQNLYTAVVNARSMLWLVERMIELRVAKTAVKEWSEQETLTANLKRALSDDAWRNVAPGLPAVVLRCTCRLASALAAGSIIASRQVRLKLVNDWLPVLVVSRENTVSATQNRQLHQELEDVFLRIILTLPIGDAQKLLQQCLCFATRTVEDCPHLVSAFDTWFRRASRESTLGSEDNESEEVW